MLKWLPWPLICLRILLTPFTVLFVNWGLLGYPYIALMLVAALSDVYDGVLARKYKVETAALRQWDSIADTIFFMGVFAGMCIAYQSIVKQYALGICSIIGIETIRYIFDFLKFQRGASYHAISAKIFGVSLLAATIAIMGFGKAEPLMTIAMLLGILSELEGLIISFILPEWTYNIKHLGKALKIRNGR